MAGKKTAKSSNNEDKEECGSVKQSSYKKIIIIQ